MNRYVVDASVAVKWIIPEVFSGQALRLREPGYELHAPDFLVLEIGSLLTKRVRRAEMNPALASRIDRLFRLHPPLTLHTWQSVYSDAFDLAIATQRSLYDCVYLALAIELDALLVTADRKFYDALQAGTLAGRLLWIEQLP